MNNDEPIATTFDADAEVGRIARRHGFSTAAAQAMLDALRRGNAGMAQFDHPEFGGAGQWMRGGMVMVGDMFNQMLKARVDDLCNELARLAAPRAVPGGSTASAASTLRSPARAWWPAELGSPASAGAQNAMRYAYFPATRRLAIEVDGRLATYDTLDHRIDGVSQQQGGTASMTFTSQHGPVRLDDLPLLTAGASQR